MSTVPSVAMGGPGAQHLKDVRVASAARVVEAHDYGGGVACPRREHGAAVRTAIRGRRDRSPCCNAGKQILSSYYRDPYLLAIWRELGDSGDVEDKWFTGYENQPRRLSLTRSGAAVRCVPSGFELSPPDPPAEAFETVCAYLGAIDDAVVVPQVAVDGRWIDTVDRVQLGAEIVRRLIAAGL